MYPALPPGPMEENVMLGPVDPELGKYPAASILKLLQKKEPKNIDDKILADVAEKAQNQARAFVKDMLSGQMLDEDAERLGVVLMEGRWTHDYPITYEEAKLIGLPVHNNLPTEIHELMEPFPQAIQRRPSVEYIPVPYRKEGGEERK